jgi:protein-tyrosine phosphatase
MNFQSILVVCAGNICRSPMAEGLLKQKFPDRKISSAGLEGLIDHPADLLAVETMSELGIDISMHLGRLLDQEMLVHADLVLAMSAQQVSSIEERWGFSRGKVFRFCHWSRENIPDPYRKGRSDFLLVKTMIQKGLKDWQSYL